MGLFDKIKGILFEEEEVEDIKTPVKEEKENTSDFDDEPIVKVKPLPEVNNEVKVKEAHFESVDIDSKPTADFSERDLFRSESTFKFPALNEEEFEESMPRLINDEGKKNVTVSDYERRRKEERKQEYSRLDSYKAKEEVKEEKKRFKPSPVISPVYGILDKDYKFEDIKEAPKDQDNGILSNKDLDVEIVRKKAFGKLEDTLKSSPKKAASIRETYEVKEEAKKEEKPIVVEEDVIEDVIISDKPILDDNLMEERAKTIDELLKDASDDVLDGSLDEKNDVKLDYDSIEDELSNEFDDDIKIDDDIIVDNTISEEKEEESKKDALENDTLENDLYDLIDSMYDNTEDGE